MSVLNIQEAKENDIALVIQFIHELAVYEKMQDDVVITEALLHEQLFVKKSAACILAWEQDVAVGFALYFYNFSTFLGRNGLYLEDLFVKPIYRGKGYGKEILLYLKELAIQQGCGRMEWSVLNWNTPAIEFYESLGAQSMKEWTVYRMNLL